MGSLPINVHYSEIGLRVPKVAIVSGPTCTIRLEARGLEAVSSACMLWRLGMPSVIVEVVPHIRGASRTLRTFSPCLSAN